MRLNTPGSTAIKHISGDRVGEPVVESALDGFPGDMRAALDSSLTLDEPPAPTTCAAHLPAAHLTTGPDLSATLDLDATLDPTRHPDGSLATNLFLPVILPVLSLNACQARERLSVASQMSNAAAPLHIRTVTVRQPRLADLALGEAAVGV